MLGKKYLGPILCIVIIFEVISLCVSCVGGTLSTNELKGFDDTVLFKINWPGRNGDDLSLMDFPDDETLLVTTENNERYKCLLPHFQEKEKVSTEGYYGPTAFELLSPIFAEYSSCSYRLESYWTYELCHGKHIRQFHEEREGKKVQIQEYYLGRWDKDQVSNLEKQLAKEDLEARPRSEIPVKKIDGLNMPYVQLNMTGGTMCDLNEQPRNTKVLYVCFPHAKHEIYSLKETSTCEYEVIVLSPVLCLHPKYKAQESGENIINCHPLDKTPKKPKNFIEMEAESLKLRHQRHLESETQLKVEIYPVQAEAGVYPGPPYGVSESEDTSPLVNLVSGKTCLHGGSGWWKYEFCYEKSVSQYHIERDLSRTTINLGKFIKANHIEWLEKNPHKRPKRMGKSISHFYSDGTICDKTGRPRQTEVKMKCLGMSLRPTSISLFLLEPKPCEYVLGVESVLICDMLHKVDENGLLIAPINGAISDEMIVSLAGEEADGDDDEREDEDASEEETVPSEGN